MVQQKDMEKITLLGATGSIGSSSLKIVAEHPERYQIYALAACRNVARMLELCQRFRPQRVVMADEHAAAELAKHLADKGLNNIDIGSGSAAVEELGRDRGADCVIAAIVGAAGLPAIFAAVQAQRKLLLANKEALVMSGRLLLQQAAKLKVSILPVDSEHNAIFQCLPSAQAMRRAPLAQAGVQSLILTASGGPFRKLPLDELAWQTPEQACAHPNWAMGRKISVDSATMMNKGLEIIEAALLFQADSSQIEVLIHPQSVVHSMVRYLDGSVLAQFGVTDMCLPIAHALAWPERLVQAQRHIDFLNLPPLQFSEVEAARYPCFYLARRILQEQAYDLSPVLNAANEIAVAAFLERRIPFTAIAAVVEESLNRSHREQVKDLQDVFSIDERSRCLAREIVSRWQA